MLIASFFLLISGTLQDMIVDKFHITGKSHKSCSLSSSFTVLTITFHFLPNKTDERKLKTLRNFETARN